MDVQLEDLPVEGKRGMFSALKNLIMNTCSRNNQRNSNLDQYSNIYNGLGKNGGIISTLHRQVPTAMKITPASSQQRNKNNVPSEVK
jgi:hypothetical protein